MSRRARFAALALAIIMLVSAVAAVPLLYRGHSHNCIGENCPVCLAITLIKDLEKTLFYAGLSFIFVLIYVAVLKTAWAITPPASVTPVSLKVKMTD